MIYALIHYPNIDIRKINLFRKKYDPQIGLIQPHITVMFPVPESVGESFLVNHIGKVLRSWEPFSIHLQGVQKSRDNQLFLMVQEGAHGILALHNKIYNSRLRAYLKAGIPFVPHVTLGDFNQNIKQFHEALEEADRLGFDYYCLLDKLHLIKVDQETSQIVWSKEFSLRK